MANSLCLQNLLATFDFQSCFNFILCHHSSKFVEYWSQYPRKLNYHTKTSFEYWDEGGELNVVEVNVSSDPMEFLKFF